MPVPHQPPNNIPLASSLPKVSFRKIHSNEALSLLTPAGVQDQQHINFGFNDGSEFEKPEHYLRYVEPIESELNKQVEYDMDEQDQEWLDTLNMERRRDQQDVISYEVFEIIIDRLEKEWFDLIKRVPPKPVPIAIGPDGELIGDGNEDIECAICDDGECENSNAIVFCDGCNLAVHQDCYGIPYIPEGQWLCRKCTVSPDRAVSCLLCPHEGGAFKQTTQGKWAHLLCAMWIPETGVSNPVYMEPIDSVERIPKARWKLQCYLCRHRMGACIQCDNKNCFTAFHVTCARRKGLLLKSQRQRVTHSEELDSEDDDSGEVMRAWCHKHVPKALRAQRAARQDDDEEEAFQDASSQPQSPSPVEEKRGQSSTIMPKAPGRKKSARAYKKSFRAKLSLVPAYVMNRVLEHISRIHVRKKAQLAVQIAKYWTLKREARRGAPLLKRLHLEPWTATTNNKEQSDAERIKKLQFLLRLREDLEKVRMLAELVRKREREKLRQVQVIRNVLVDGILFPYHDKLRKVLERISALDRTSLFLHPVSPQKVPDYYDIIKRPMDWTSIAAKIDDYQYNSVAEFQDDVDLVLNNAMLYNHIDTLYHRTAARIKKVAESIFEGLRRGHGAEDGIREDLQLEAEEGIINLLENFSKEESGVDPAGWQDPVEELTAHYHFVVPEAPAINGDVRRVSAQARKAAERAIRSERSRLAAQRRKEEKQARQSEGATAEISTMDLSQVESNRMSRRKSAIKASQASLEARKKRGKRAPSDDQEGGEHADEGASTLSEGSHNVHTKLEVEKVNNWDSFKRFNSGWVLPEGSKRRRLTQSSEANTLLAEKAGVLPRSEKPITSSDHFEASKPAITQVLSRKSEVAEPTGSRKRKRTESDSKSSARTSSQPSPDKALKRGTNGRFARIDEKKAQGVRAGVKSGAGGGSNKTGRETMNGSLKRKMKGAFEPSTLCWAKLEGHPFFPAEVFEEDSVQVPARVMQNKPSRLAGGEAVYLVRFFDPSRSFGWIAESKLKLLHEDQEIDKRMLKASKNSHHRSKVRASYHKALAELA